MMRGVKLKIKEENWVILKQKYRSKETNPMRVVNVENRNRTLYVSNRGKIQKILWKFYELATETEIKKEKIKSAFIN
mgnify:FL=1